MKYTQTFMLLLLVVGAGFLTSCGDGKSDVFNDTASGANAADPAQSMPAVWYGLSKEKDQSLDDVLTRRNFMVVIDGSGSMSGSKMDQAKTSATEFLKAVPPDDNLGLVTFDASGIVEQVPLGINNRLAFNSIVSKMKAGGGTPLKSSIENAVKALRVQAQKQQGYGEYHLLVVTDGEANAGEDPTDVVNKTLQFSPIVVHVIGFNIGPDHSLNQPGRTDYKTADNVKQLVEGMKAVLAESPSFDEKDATFTK